MKHILVTGGLDYIGSHTVVELISNGYNPVILDNLSNSNLKVLEKIKEITGKDVSFVFGDVRDPNLIGKTLIEYKVEVVLHFAGLKSVSESHLNPYLYYDNNLIGSLTLANEMVKHKISNLIFSSSATVYGIPEKCPINENFKTSTTNPYGQSKLMVEKCLHDIHKANPDLKISLLRYFNPIGAHKSGLIGESPTNIPNNLMPYISQVAIGNLKYLSVFGNDYETEDGTCIRDYIHVVDLAKGHISALSHMLKNENFSFDIFNLGTGNGYSVFTMIDKFKEVTKKDVPYIVINRREGDVAECWSDPKKAYDILGWKASYDLEQMIEDLWRWQVKNPNGFS